MRFIVCLIFALGWCSLSVASPSRDPYHSLLARTGVSLHLNELPQDILRAANQNARRCGSAQVQLAVTTEDLTGGIVRALKNNPNISPGDVRELSGWYTSRTGRKVRRLERRVVDASQLQRHIPDDDRLAAVTQIYQNKNAAAFIADVAAEIEYTGWRLSQCVQTAAGSGDLKNLQTESTRGRLIRGEADTIRALFEQDILLEMEYVLSTLSDEEHREYQAVSRQFSEVYVAIVSSMIHAIKSVADEVEMSLRD